MKYIALIRSKVYGSSVLILFSIYYSESICTTSSPGKVPHPYEVSMYVQCSDQEPRLTVRSCSPGFVFDASKADCADPYAASKRECAFFSDLAGLVIIQARKNIN